MIELRDGRSKPQKRSNLHTRDRSYLDFPLFDSLPRIRGGVSDNVSLLGVRDKSSPHTRGCFRHRLGSHSPCRVFPAYAGVFPFRRSARPTSRSLPRIRGGVSTGRVRREVKKKSSPHTRGCFQESGQKVRRSGVFPAYAGVFPRRLRLTATLSSLPRIRGGVSFSKRFEIANGWSSPHTRGCFSRYRLTGSHGVVFPAYAGVFPPPENGHTAV